MKKRKKYARDKGMTGLLSAISQAYIDGYQKGYADCKSQLPAAVKAVNDKYVDLGLPSGTLWAKDYIKVKNKLLSDRIETAVLPFHKAKQYNLPTKEQFDELWRVCRHEYYGKNYCGGPYIEFTAPNGNQLSLKILPELKDSYERNLRLWFKSEITPDNEVSIGKLHFQDNQLQKYDEKQFTGFGLPVLEVI